MPQVAVKHKATPLFSSCAAGEARNDVGGPGEAGPAGERARNFEHTDGELMDFMHIFEHNQSRLWNSLKQENVVLKNLTGRAAGI